MSETSALTSARRRTRALDLGGRCSTCARPAAARAARWRGRSILCPTSRRVTSATWRPRAWALTRTRAAPHDRASGLHPEPPSDSRPPRRMKSVATAARRVIKGRRTPVPPPPGDAPPKSGRITTPPNRRRWGRVAVVVVALGPRVVSPSGSTTTRAASRSSATGRSADAVSDKAVAVVLHPKSRRRRSAGVPDVRGHIAARSSAHDDHRRTPPGRPDGYENEGASSRATGGCGRRGALLAAARTPRSSGSLALPATRGAVRITGARERVVGVHVARDGRSTRSSPSKWATEGRAACASSGPDRGDRARHLWGAGVQITAE